MIELCYEDRDLLVCVKPPDCLSEDGPGEGCLPRQLAAQYRAAGKPDFIAGVHRLDKPVGGLMVFSRRKAVTGKLISAMAEHRVCKEYLAVLRGVLVAAAITIIGVAVFALILNWWNASDRAITAINQVVKFVSILAGVTTAMHAGESGGAMRGACVGLLYMALGIVCYALMMGQSPQLAAYLADLGMGLAAGGLFGMILTTRKKG